MAIPYQPPGVLTVNQLQSAPLVPALTTGQEIPSFIGFPAPGTAGYPTQLDTFAAGAYGTTVVLSKNGVEYQGAATAVPEAALIVYNPTTYQTINYANYNATTSNTVNAQGATVTTTTIGFVNYAGPVSVNTNSTGNTIVNGQYRYGVSYVINQNTAGGNSYYETGLGTSYTIANATASLANIGISGIGTGQYAAGPIGPVVGINVYRAKNLGSSASPYWGPWYQVYNNSTGVALAGFGTVTISGYNTSSITDTTADPTGNPTPPASLNPGDTFQVSYQYADSSYYLPTLFTNYADIESKYGPAFDTNGNVLSQLSFGAKLAMLNGASQVICTAASTSDSLWGNAFASLVNDHDSTIIVPLTGNESIHAAAAAHCTQMQQYNVFRTAIFGADGVSGTVTPALLQSNATSYNRKDIQYVSPSIFRYYNTRLNIENQVGGQYAAAAVAGMHAARRPQDSLTRQVIAGFSSIGDARSFVGMNTDAANGLTVLEQKGSSIRIRHDISTAPSDVNTREWPVIQQTYNMIRNILGLYDTSVVGQYKSNQTGLLAVQNITNGYLRNLVSAGQLDSYSGLNVNFNPSDPTAVNVSWTYKPVYTILYVNITIGLSLTSGSTSVNTVVSNSATNGNVLL